MTQTATAATETNTTAAKAKFNKSTINVGSDFIEGTVADIIGRGKESRLRINKKIVKQPDLSALVRLGLATEVGFAERAPGTKGPKPAIIRIPTNLPGMAVARR